MPLETLHMLPQRLTDSESGDSVSIGVGFPSRRRVNDVSLLGTFVFLAAVRFEQDLELGNRLGLFELADSFDPTAFPEFAGFFIAGEDG